MSAKNQVCEIVADAVLANRTVEHQAYRSCRALLDLGRRQRRFLGAGMREGVLEDMRGGWNLSPSNKGSQGGFL